MISILKILYIYLIKVFFSKSETMNMSRIYFFFLSLTYSCDISRRDQVTITMIYEMYTPTFFKVNLTNNPPPPPKKRNLYFLIHWSLYNICKLIWYNNQCLIRFFKYINTSNSFNTTILSILIYWCIDIFVLCHLKRNLASPLITDPCVLPFTTDPCGSPLIAYPYGLPILVDLPLLLHVISVDGIFILILVDHYLLLIIVDRHSLMVLVDLSLLLILVDRPLLLINMERPL